VPLDRKIILSQAFSLLNELGLEGLTLRRLAARLGIQAPAIYWHFKNKQELLDEMATHVLREVVENGLGLEPERDWEEWAIAYSESLRRTLLQYRDGAKMFSGTYLTDAGLFAGMEMSLRKLSGSGFKLRQAVISLGALYAYTVGFVIEEQAQRPIAGKPDPRYDLERRDERIDKEKYPLAHAAGREMFQEPDARFLGGVRLIVAGMSASLSPEV
jgi:TetR/AcrR family transcriptional regulator, tetracycline repressor protein